MQPEKNSTDSARDQAERQSNYLILSSLEQKLPPELFAQILTEVSDQKNQAHHFTDLGVHAPASSPFLGGKQI